VRDHRTIRSYPANLGHNVVEVWRKESLLPLLIGTGATAVSFLGDNSTIRYFDRHPMKTYGDVGRVLGTGAVAAVASTAILGVGRYANGDRFRAATYDMSQAVVVSFFYTLIIKESTRRDRPDHSDHLAFPSGHASNAFACATVWAEQYGWKAAVPGYLAAGFIAGSRLALKKHRLSDVVGRGDARRHRGAERGALGQEALAQAPARGAEGLARSRYRPRRLRAGHRHQRRLLTRCLPPIPAACASPSWRTTARCASSSGKPSATRATP